MAKAPKRTVRRRREKKNIERGAAHIQSITTLSHRYKRQRPFLGQRCGYYWQP